MLLIDVIVLVCRLKKQTQMFSKVIDKDNQCKDVFSEISDLRGLITAFRKGNVMEDKFAVCCPGFILTCLTIKGAMLHRCATEK